MCDNGGDCDINGDASGNRNGRCDSGAVTMVLELAEKVMLVGGFLVAVVKVFGNNW